MNHACLHLAELRSIENRCNFATICARKGYVIVDLYSMQVRTRGIHVLLIQHIFLL